MKQLYDIVVEDEWKMMGTDNQMSVDLSFLQPSDCTITTSHVKAERKSVPVQINVQCTANAGQLRTTVIQGNKHCTQIVGTIVGSAEHCKADGQAVLLADKDIQWQSVSSYQGKGTIADLQAYWVSDDSSGVVQLKAWFTEAGQSTTRAC